MGLIKSRRPIQAPGFESDDGSAVGGGGGGSMWDLAFPYPRGGFPFIGRHYASTSYEDYGPKNPTLTFGTAVAPAPDQDYPMVGINRRQCVAVHRTSAVSAVGLYFCLCGSGSATRGLIPGMGYWAHTGVCVWKSDTVGSLGTNTDWCLVFCIGLDSQPTDVAFVEGTYPGHHSSGNAVDGTAYVKQRGGGVDPTAIFVTGDGVDAESTDTGIDLSDAAWHDILIVENDDGGVECWIDGELVATHTSKVPVRGNTYALLANSMNAAMSNRNLVYPVTDGDANGNLYLSHFGYGSRTGYKSAT